jgi:hypothetical protein
MYTFEYLNNMDMNIFGAYYTTNHVTYGELVAAYYAGNGIITMEEWSKYFYFDRR